MDDAKYASTHTGGKLGDGGSPRVYARRVDDALCVP